MQHRSFSFFGFSPDALWLLQLNWSRAMFSLLLAVALRWHPWSMATLGTWLHPWAQPPLSTRSPPNWRCWCGRCGRALVWCSFSCEAPGAIIPCHHPSHQASSSPVRPAGACAEIRSGWTLWSQQGNTECFPSSAAPGTVPGAVPGRWHWQLVVTGWGWRLDEHCDGAEPGAPSPCVLRDVPAPPVRHRDLR